MTGTKHDLLKDCFRILIEGSADEVKSLAHDYVFRGEVAAEAESMAHAAYSGDQDAYAEMHKFLFDYYGQQFSMVDPARAQIDSFGAAIDVVSIFEEAVLSNEERQVASFDLTDMPRTGSAFVSWFQNVAQNHPAWHHPFYVDFLARRASIEDFRYYLTQETTLDPRFDDLLALVQIGTSGHIKLEIASNYWDEMGCGKEAEVHTVLFSKALAEIGADQAYITANTSLASKASGNLSSLLGLKRRHFCKAIGYFGITEYLAPHRFKCVVQGWRRNKLPVAGIIYHDLHIGVDSGHSLGWMHNVISPMIDRDPCAAREIALGAFFRLNSSARYLASLDRDRFATAA